MKIKSKQIKELNNLLKEKVLVNEALSDNLKTEQDRYGANEIELERGGKKVKITEKILWQEVFYGGKTSEAGKILSKKYPVIFELQTKSEELDKKINNFTMVNWGFFYNQMTLGVLINLIIATINWRIKRFFFLD